MKLLLVLLLISSCSQMPTYRNDYNSLQTKAHLVKTTRIGVKCPNGYYYSFKADMCYNQLITGDSRDIKSTITRASKPRAKKALKTAKIDCKEVLKRTNQCMAGN